MSRKHSIPVLSAILEVIELQSEMVEPVSFAKTVCDDPDDDKFLKAALLQLINCYRIRTVKLAPFLKVLPR